MNWKKYFAGLATALMLINFSHVSADGVEIFGAEFEEKKSDTQSTPVQPENVPIEVDETVAEEYTPPTETQPVQPPAEVATEPTPEIKNEVAENQQELEKNVPETPATEIRNAVDESATEVKNVVAENQQELEQTVTRTTEEISQPAVEVKNVVSETPTEPEKVEIEVIPEEEPVTTTPDDDLGNIFDFENQPTEETTPQNDFEIDNGEVQPATPRNPNVTVKRVPQNTAEETTPKSSTSTKSKNLKKQAARFVKVAVDDTYDYYLDKKSVSWKKIPYLNDEFMADVWIRMIERSADYSDMDDDMAGYISGTSEEVRFAREQGIQLDPVDIKVLNHRKYVIEHYYLRPKTQQIQFISALEVIGHPQNTASERKYDVQNWEYLIPGSIESSIYEGVLKITGKSKSTSRGHMTFADYVEEYARISIR